MASSNAILKWRKLKNARKSLKKLQEATDAFSADVTGDVITPTLEATEVKTNNNIQRASKLQLIFDIIDDDNSGEIDSNEFVSAMKNNQQVRAFFGLEETDSDTQIAEEYFEKMFKLIDDDGDENISYEEFEKHIAQMALKSIVNLRKEFESTLGEEKQRINEKLSKFAAKQINKSQKKLDKTLKKLEDGAKKIEQYESLEKELVGKAKEYENKLKEQDAKLNDIKQKYIEEKQKPMPLFYKELVNQFESEKQNPTSAPEILPGMLEIMVLNAKNLNSVKNVELLSKDTKMNPYVSISAPWIEAKQEKKRNQETAPAKGMDRNPKWDDSHNNILQFEVNESHILYKNSLLSDVFIHIMDDDTDMTSVDDVICETHLNVRKYLTRNIMKWETIKLDMVHRVNSGEESEKAGVLCIKIRHVANATQKIEEANTMNEKTVGAYILKNGELCRKIGLANDIKKSELEVAFEVLNDQRTIDSLEEFESFMLRFPGMILSDFLRRQATHQRKDPQKTEVYKAKLSYQLSEIHKKSKKEYEKHLKQHQETIRNLKKTLAKEKEKQKASLDSLETFSLEDKKKSISTLKLQHEQEINFLQQTISDLTLENKNYENFIKEREREHKAELQMREKNVGDTNKQFNLTSKLHAVKLEKIKETNQNQTRNIDEIDKDEMQKLQDELRRMKVLKNRSERETMLALEENKKLDDKINSLTATINDMERAHSNVESEIVMETKVNTILLKAQNIMIAFSNGETKTKCKVEMEHLLHEFDRSSRKLLDIHDESQRHTSFIRSKLEQILTSLGGTGHNTFFRTSDRHFIPKRKDGGRRNHRQPPMVIPPSHNEAVGLLSTSDLSSPPKPKEPWQKF